MDAYAWTDEGLKFLAKPSAVIPLQPTAADPRTLGARSGREILRLAEENRVLKAKDAAVDQHLPAWEAEQLEAVRIREAALDDYRAVIQQLSLRCRELQQRDEARCSEVNMRAEALEADLASQTVATDAARRECADLQTQVEALEEELRQLQGASLRESSWKATAYGYEKERELLESEVTQLRELNATQAENIRMLLDEREQVKVHARALVEALLGEDGEPIPTRLVTLRKEDCAPLLVPEDRAADFAEAGWFPEDRIDAEDEDEDDALPTFDASVPDLSALSARQIWEAMTPSQRTILGVGNRVSLSEWERTDHQ